MLNNIRSFLILQDIFFLMKHCLLYVLLFLTSITACAAEEDTLFVDNYQDARYIRYMDSLKGYEIGLSVAKNISDTLKSMYGISLEAYFLGKYYPESALLNDGYFFDFDQDVQVIIGRVNLEYKRMRNDSTFPWGFVEAQYKRLNDIKVQPCGKMQGAELPSIYVYCKPTMVVAYKKMKRFTVIDPKVRFFYGADGKTKTSYITKLYYVEYNKVHQRIDSIEKLDPITFKHIDE